MTGGPISRSTPLRLTARLIAVFSISTLLSFGAAFIIVTRSADANLRAQVLEDFDSYKLVRNQAALIERLLADIATAPPETLIIDYRTDSGSRLSNVPGLPALSGFSIVPASRIPLDQSALADSYLIVAGRVGQGSMTMARNREYVTSLWETFTVILLVNLLPTLIVATGIGVWAARRARNRVEAIRNALRSLTKGQLDTRVPALPGAPDDLSDIGAAVNRMAEAQAASVSSLRQVSADIAHDLRTPIQRVSVLLERLAATDALTLAQADIVDTAQSETAQIVRTFQSLLQIAQIEGAGPRSGFADLELRPLIAGLVDVYEPSAEESGHHLVLAPGEGPAKVHGERNLLGQVAANLIENALRHTPAGSTITVAVTDHPDGARLTIRDDGPGVPEAERGNVLRRHYRLESSRTSEGSGLGLSLVAAICDLHGATLSLDDNAPGLVVEVAFPPA